MLIVTITNFWNLALHECACISDKSYTPTSIQYSVGKRQYHDDIDCLRSNNLSASKNLIEMRTNSMLFDLSIYVEIIQDFSPDLVRTWGTDWMSFNGKAHRRRFSRILLMFKYGDYIIVGYTRSCMCRLVGDWTITDQSSAHDVS